MVTQATLLQSRTKQFAIRIVKLFRSEEADETVFWLELLSETGIVEQRKLVELLLEANELLAIFAASQRTAKLTRK